MAELTGSSCRILNCTGCKILGKGKGKAFCKLFSVGQSKLKRCMIKNKKNLSVHILKVASVLEDDRGEAIGAVEVLTDMTNLVQKQQEIETLKHMFHLDDGFNGLLGKTPVMEKLFQLISSVAQSDAPVLIQGESGTGKELVSSAIHFNSTRKHQPFVRINCAAITETLLESELFGHEKGAFTGALHRKTGLVESASGGTLFLDEVGDIPLPLQVKLLRLLESGTYRRVGGVDTLRSDFRLICAFNPSPVRTACSMQYSFITGNMPGMAASTRDTLVFGSLPNTVDAPENSFEFDATCAWTSSPMTTSQSPVRPEIR